MVKTSRNQVTALWLSWIVATLMAVVVTAAIYFNERSNRLDEAEQRLQTEAAYLQHLVATSLANGEFEQARNQLAAWGRLNADTIELSLVADNGFALGEFHRQLVGHRTHSHSAQIEFSYRGHARLTLTKTLEPLFASISQFGWQLILALILVEAFAMILAYQLVRYRRQVRRTQKEYDQRLEAQSALERMATLDSLTGLPNRYMLDEQLWLRVAEMHRFERKMALLFVDIDNFKHINDSFGHEAGDDLLKLITERLSGCLRSYDLLARFGGDEFVVLLPNIETIDDVEHVAEKITHALQPKIALGTREMFVSASIGISFFPDDGDSPGELLRKADAAMYTAKESGRNCYRFYTESMNLAIDHRHAIESGLHRAIANRELYLVYQPQLDIHSQQIRSCEALLRWRTDEREISPAEFIPIAEQSALIKPLQAYVMETAFKQRAEWKRKGLDDIRIDINVSGGRLLLSDIFATVDEALQTHGLDYSDIGIELTEHTLIDASEETISSLSRLRELGTTISLDDFGTGYSSLGYLKRLPVDVLKIDRNFIKDLPHGAMDGAIVKAVISMGRSMGKKTLAEGVETYEQLAYVRNHGCDLAQGFFLHRPMLAADLEALLTGGNDNSRRSTQGS